MQTSQAFGQVQDALSFFRTSYDTFAQYRATLTRLDGFQDANRQARALHGVDIGKLADGLQNQGMNVQRTDGSVVLHGLHLKMTTERKRRRQNRSKACAKRMVTCA